MKKLREEAAMEGAGKNNSQLEELRDPKKHFLNKYCGHAKSRTVGVVPFAPLGHIRSVLLDLDIVKIKEWDKFLDLVQEELQIGGNNFAFSSNLEASIPSRMFDNIFPVLRKHYRRRMTCGKYRRLIEESYGHPFMIGHYLSFCIYCTGFKLLKLKLS